jgi:hypothetical protein
MAKEEALKLRENLISSSLGMSFRAGGGCVEYYGQWCDLK